MTTLVPRVFGDLADWLETDYSRRTGMIKVEGKIVTKYANGILEIAVPLKPEPAAKQIAITKA